ncbi:3-hydroxyisobutyryl-CoA hydrolase [Chlorella vulgaris]
MGHEKKGISSAKAQALSQAGAGGGFSGASTSTSGFSFGAKYVSAVQAAVPGGAGGGLPSASSDAALRASAIIPADLDSEVAQQLQKLSKRDATTKLKALQALKLLFREKPAADVQAALPSWAYLFSRLVLDSNRSVRSEACHVTATAAATVGRGIAPLLKSLLPSWWLAQFDGYSEAAAAAKAAFAAAFPAPAKQRDAVLFCRAEVLQLLGDNLVSTPQSLGDAKKESVEELQDRHERVLASSCAALAALVEMVAPASSGGQQPQQQGSSSSSSRQQNDPTQQSPAEQDVLAVIQAQLQAPAFYKSVLQSKAAPVRRAAYGLVAAAAERAARQLLAAASSAAAVLSALADKEAGNHEAMWGMLLAYVRALPDCWDHVNMQKAFLPRLTAFLRHACYGSPRVSYPALLPLLSLLPQEVLGPRPTLFVSLLDSLWQGLAALAGGTAAGSSKQAREAAAAAYLDCLLYGVLRADELALVGGSGGTGGTASGTADGGTSPGKLYSAELLEASLGGALMPAVVVTDAAAAALAAEAEAVLCGAVSKLAGPTASACSHERLDQLLRLVGCSLVSALQAASSGDTGSEPYDCAAALVSGLKAATGAGGSTYVGTAVAQPLLALLLPEVRNGTAPPAASSLLSSLLQSFPQHAASEAAAGGSGGTDGGESASPASPAAELSGDMSLLRLHQSASFTIDSVVRRLLEGQEDEAAAASCELLLSCLPHVQQPARKLADVLVQLLQQLPQQCTSTALLLVQHLVSGSHSSLYAAACQTTELDRVAALVAGSASDGGLALASETSAPELLALLLTGDGTSSLLSAAAQQAVLSQLLHRLQAAAAQLQEAGGEAAAPAATFVAAAVLLVLERSLVLPPPALETSSSSSSRGGSAVRGLQLELLASSLRLLLQCVASDAEAAAVASASEDGASSFEDESGEESVELPVAAQPGAAAAAAAQVWQQREAVSGLLTAATAQQQAAFVGAVNEAVGSVLMWHPSSIAALAAADAAAPLLAALGIASGLQQRLLQALAGIADDDTPSSSSSSSSSSSIHTASMAVFTSALGMAAGFDCLLPTSRPSAAAQAAVTLLGALHTEPAVAREERRQLLQYVAGTAAAALLQPALQAAAASRDPAVLCALLRAAVGSSSSTSLAACARFFASAAAAGKEQQQQEQQQQVLQPALLRQLLPIVAPAFRGSSMLLQQSGLAVLSQQLCQQSIAIEPVALATDADQQAASLELLAACVACFPCATGAESAAQLPAPAAATAGGPGGSKEGGQATASSSSSGSTGAFSRGDMVWYRQRDGSWVEAVVASIDLSVQPPSYSIQIPSSSSNGHRETEGSRLAARQPGSSPPAAAAAADDAAPAAAAAAALAAEKRAAGGSTLPAAGCCTADEQGVLLQLLQHQARGAKAALSAARAVAAAAAAADSRPAEAVSPAVAAAVVGLLHAGVAYAGQQLSQQQWTLLLDQLRLAFAHCSAALAAAAARVAGTVCAAAASIAVGADMQSPALALQFFRRLRVRGVLERSAKAQQEAQRVTASLEAELAGLDDQLLPVLLPALQAYTQAAAMAGASRSLSLREWQEAEASLCGDMLQLFVTSGAIAAAAGVSGPSAAELAGWMGGRRGEESAAQESAAAAAWQLLSQHVATTLHAADRSFLLAAVDRANGGMDATGVDALGSLLALSLSGIPPPGMAAAAFSAILQHTELTAALTGAEGIDEEQLEEEQQAQGRISAADGSDAAALLEQVGVRPELAMAVAGGGGTASGGGWAGFFSGWALLLVHILSRPADSHGRRLLAQAVKDAHTLVPALLDALVPLLPLDAVGGSPGSGGGRRDSAGAAPATRLPVAMPASKAASVSSSSISFVSQLLDAGPFASSDSSSSSSNGGELSPQQQRFAALLYAAVLQALPASARLWFADLRDRGTAAAVERYTAAAVSGQVLAAELAAVTAAAAAFGKFDKFSVRANASNREVEDGHLLELAVKLPASMPLRAPELECRRKVGVSEGRLRKWLLSISGFLRMQNGSVAEAVSLWKRNVDKEFEGQEECLICYSIIQHTSGQLPRLSCRTCRKRFHGGCLYKWFKSSGKSTCPHCQSPCMSASGDCEVLHDTQQHVGVAVLNRPKALNALNCRMVEALYDLYTRWDADPSVACIGAGEKAFCAGGDVKTVVQQGQAGKVHEALRFFRSEYRLNHLISELRAPHVAIIDGITMGGGVGVSVHGTFRVATERTVFAMPECGIGLYPDVGGSFFLPRLPGGLGMYLALTGARLQGVDVRHGGIATHYIPSRLLPELHQSIVGLGPAAGDAAALGDVLSAFEGREALPEGQLASNRAAIDACFAGKQSVEDIYAACERNGGQWGADTLAQMSKGSPMSQKLSFEQLRRGASMDLASCLQMENRMVTRCVENVGSDFYAGVQAVLIDRSGSPSWSPASLNETRSWCCHAKPPSCDWRLAAAHSIAHRRPGRTERLRSWPGLHPALPAALHIQQDKRGIACRQQMPSDCAQRCCCCTVLFPHGGQEYEIKQLASAKDAGIVCDLLTLKEAVDGQLDAKTLQLRSQYLASLTARQLSDVLHKLRGSEVCNISFEGVLAQLQACSTEAAKRDGLQGPALSTRLLLAAAGMGHTTIVQLLLAADPQAASSSRGILPLHFAAGKGHTATCQVLLDQAPQTVTAICSKGCNPLHCAAQGGHTAVCQLLLDKAPQAALAVTSKGLLPLHLAAGNGHLAALQLLLDRAPQAATTASSGGMLPLHVAASYGHTSAVQLLLDREPHTVTAADPNGWLPLHLAAKKGHIAVCVLLLHKTPQTATAATSRGSLPLHLAAEQGHTAICQLLLDKAPQTATAVNATGELPLHRAAQQGHTAVLEVLLAVAPHTAAMTDMHGRVPLHCALAPQQRGPHLDAACCLLTAGRTPDVLAALLAVGPAVQPLFGDFAAVRLPLTSEEWAALPTRCPGLGRALPAAIGHSAEQAKQLVQHLPPFDALRLRTAALSLHRAQKQRHVFLPSLIVWDILALSV